MKKKKNEKFKIDELPEDGTTERSENSALSEEELAMLKASISSAKIDRSTLPPHDTSGKATLFRLMRSNMLFTVAAIIVAASMVFAVAAGTAIFSIKLINDLRSYTVIIGEDEPYKVGAADAVIDDVLYVDMRKIAAHVGLTLSGSPTRMQFTSIKNGTYLLFENENEYAIINGGRTEMLATTLSGDNIVSAKAYVSEEECLVPYTFLARTVSEDTMTFVFDEGTKTLLVRPKYFVYDGDVENRIMKDLVFITDNFEISLPETEQPTYTYSYAIDIEPYLSSIDTEYLMLVNKENAAGKYKPARLKELTCPTTRSNLALDYDAAVALEAMMLEMEVAGVTDTYVTSAYRSYDRQVELYWGYVDDEKAKDPSISDEEAQRRASEYSARPGESEHQTGLCFDFITKEMGGSLDERFEQTDAFKWLSKNAYKYGFILRYPKDDVSTTGYQYEPWHYRFVGRQAASEIYFSGMCLEEYLGGQ